MELRESFPGLEDAAGAGVAMSKSEAGDVAAGKIGSVGFAFKDSAGNLILPQLDAEGRILVSMDASGTPKKASGVVTAGQATLLIVTGAELTLTASKNHSKIAVQVSCFRESYFELQQVDNLTTTVLARFRVGPGQYTAILNHPAMEVLSGATGTQKLQVFGYNIDKLSQLDANLSLIELA